MSGSGSSSGGGYRPSGPARIGRIGQWGASSAPSSRSSAADADGEESETGGENWFTGGERSGLSVQNPNSRRNIPGGDTVRELLKKAEHAGPPPNSESSSAARQAFSGSGHTLGSDEVESQVVPDPTVPASSGPERAIRNITFWRNGFTIEDGPLLSYDDPQNAENLRLIQSGQAPPEVLNVQWGQPVELRVGRKIEEDYQAPPPQSSRPFDGSGNRLGAPMPGEGLVAASTEAATAATPQASSSSSAEERQSMQTKWEVDRTQPTASIRLRLPTNPRFNVTMNLTNTIADLRNLINATGLSSDSARTYTLFPADEPSRVLNDDSMTIADAKLDKRVVVFHWA